MHDPWLKDVRERLVGNGDSVGFDVIGKGFVTQY